MHKKMHKKSHALNVAYNFYTFFSEVPAYKKEYCNPTFPNKCFVEKDGIQSKDEDSYPCCWLQR